VPRTRAVSFITNRIWVGILYFAGAYDEAIAALQEAVGMLIRTFSCAIHGLAYEQKGMYAEAIVPVHRGQLSAVAMMFAVGHAFAASGKKRKRSEYWLIGAAKTTVRSPYTIATIYAGLRKRSGLQVLEKALMERDIG